MDKNAVNQAQVSSIVKMLLEIINDPKNAQERENFVAALRKAPELLDAFFSEQIDRWVMQEVITSKNTVFVTNIRQTVAAVREELLTKLEK